MSADWRSPWSAMTVTLRPLPTPRPEKPSTLGVEAVVLDLMMAGYDGWQVAAHLRSDLRTARIPMAVTSALHRVRGRADEIGTPYAFCKLYNSADLVAILQQIDPDSTEPAESA